MKATHLHQLFTPRHTIIGGSLTLLAVALTFSSAQAKTVDVNSGPIINGLFARIVCPNVAAQAKGTWTGEYDRKRQTCEVNIPDPVRKQTKPAKRIPNKAPANLLNVDAGRLWSQSHANQKCKQLAKANKGRWTGNWSENTKTKPSYCQIEILTVAKPKPQPRRTHKIVNIDAGRIWSQAHANQRCVALAKINKGQWTKKYSTANHKSTCEIRVALIQPKPKPTHRIIHVKAGRIWSKSHADHRCKALAKNNKGLWTGKYATKNNESTCEVKVLIVQTKPAPITPTTKPVARFKIREISARRLTSQRRAERKCKRIAEEAYGTWTGKWRKSTDQQQGMCEVKLTGQAKRPTATTIVKEADAGPIWDQAHANRKCPLIAKTNKGLWTGNWRKVGANNISVCQIRINVGNTSGNKAVVKSETTYVPLPNNRPVTPTSNIREIFAGPIWDQAQANKKCPLVAKNNKGTWTGKWRKTDTKHNSLCSIRF